MLAREYIRRSKFTDCEFIVQSGAPIMWPGCDRNEWKDLIWDFAVKNVHQKIPVLNLAGGSCYPIENIPAQIETENEANYLKNIFSYSSVKTVRDPIAKKLLDNLDIEGVQLIPCTAFLSLDIAEADERNIFLINYMEGGGHFDWNQNIDSRSWRETVEEILKRLKKDVEVAWLCHNDKEFDLAKSFKTDQKIFFPKTIKDYSELADVAVGGLFNRMHASVAFASMGIPSIAVGTDSRLSMVDQLGIKNHFVKNVNASDLFDEITDMLNNRMSEMNRLKNLKAATMKTYQEVLAPYFDEH